jgi:hypothetical protein
MANILKKTIALSLFLFFLTPVITYSQDNSLITVEKIRGDQIAIDYLGNLYVIQNALLQKYDPNGQFLFSYSNFSFGNITSVDVSNPMKIMLFYQETGTIIFLDDRLASISNQIDLYSRQYMTISLTAYSSDNKILLYDEAHADLIALDNYLNEIYRVHYNFQNFNPIQFQEIQGKMFFMHNPESGIFLFDSFGTYIKTIATQSPFPLQVYNNSIYYLKNDQLYVYNYTQLSENVWKTDMSHFKQCLVYKNRLYLLDKTGKVTIQSWQ